MLKNIITQNRIQVLSWGCWIHKLQTNLLVKSK